MPGWCCRMSSRRCVISRNEGREVGSICGQEGLPVSSAAPEAPLSALNLPEQAGLPIPPHPRWEAHIAAVESELEEGGRAVNSHHGAESGDIQTKVLCQRKGGRVSLCPLGHHIDGLALPTVTACHPGLWTWQHPSWDTTREDPKVASSWGKAVGWCDTDPSCSLPESNCPLLASRLTVGFKNKLSAGR